jgi:hypothetical protein
MMKISRLAMPLLSIGLALGAFSFGASASVAGLSGNWSNTDAHGAIPEIVVAPTSGSRVNVTVFGQCEPTNCNWGTVSGATYAPNVGGDPVNDATAATAYYQQGFAKRYVILRQRGQYLTYEIFSSFEDNSGRSSYILSGTMRHALRLIHLLSPVMVKPSGP